MLKRFHVINPKDENFTKKNVVSLQILPQISFLTKIFFYFFLILHPETQNLRMRIL